MPLCYSVYRCAYGVSVGHVANSHPPAAWVDTHLRGWHRDPRGVPAWSCPLLRHTWESLPGGAHQSSYGRLGDELFTHDEEG